MLATSASAACFAVPSVTAANLAALLLGASITIVHAPHISVNVNTTDATTGAAEHREQTRESRGPKGCTFNPVTTNKAL